MPDIHQAAATYAAQRQELLEIWPTLIDDEEALRDSLDGITDLTDILATMLRSKLSDDRQAKSLGEYIADLQKRKRRYELRAERKRDLALRVMQECQIKRIERPDLTASVRQTQGKVIVPDESLLDDLWCRITRAPDKTKIGDALRSGVDVKNAYLSNPEPTLSIRTS